MHAGVRYSICTDMIVEDRSVLITGQAENKTLTLQTNNIAFKHLSQLEHRKYSSRGRDLPGRASTRRRAPGP